MVFLEANCRRPTINGNQPGLGLAKAWLDFLAHPSGAPRFEDPGEVEA
jgi:hypothetical protein